MEKLERGHLSKVNRGYLLGYERWLSAQGYEQAVVYNSVRRVGYFLAHQQHSGKALSDYNKPDWEGYLAYSRRRGRQLGGGALSGSYLNKIALDLERLQGYLLALGAVQGVVKLGRQTAASASPQVYSIEQIEQLYAHCQANKWGWLDRAMLSLCYGCGLRSMEACRLELGAVWWETGLLQVRRGKGGKSRVVPLSPRVKAHLKGYLKIGRPALWRRGSPPKFLLSSYGGGASHGLLYDRFQRLLVKAGLPRQGLHSLRHSLASHLTDAGLPSRQLQVLLGHSSIDTTQHYIHSLQQSR